MVVGDCEGSVRFYDFQFRAWAWFENPSDGEIRSISFAHEDTMDFGEEDQDDWYKKFHCPDFVVATA